MNAIEDKDYDFICKLVYEYSRINLGENKKELVSARLGKRLRALNMGTYREYVNLLSSPQGEEELTHLIDSISTNHTHFFREIKHFEFMEQVALPYWEQKLKNGPKVFRIWSAASSSGEEPYSLAIQLQEFFGSKPGWKWNMEATDISTRILKRAQTAVYVEERVRDVRPELLRKYFQKGHGKWEGHYRVKELLRNSIRFTNLNLLQGHMPFQDPFHVIFCRNVMIYFDRPTQEQLVNTLYKHLLPGGYLMIGHSESLTGIQHPFQSLRPAIYQKPER